MTVRLGKTTQNSDGVSDKFIHIHNTGYYIDVFDGFSTERPHGRRDYQLLICTSGQGEIKLSSKRVPIEAGNALLLRPDEPQIYKYKAGASFVFVHFSGTGVKDILNELELDKTVYMCNDHNELAGAIQGMSDAFFENKKGAEIYAEGMLMAVLARLSHSRQSSNRFDKIKRIGASRNAISMSNYELAKLCDMSEYHFIREFKKSEGVTPREYILKAAIDRAKILLESNMKIHSIANELGFSDPLYFGRVFKKYVGMPPSEYRSKAKSFAL